MRRGARGGAALHAAFLVAALALASPARAALFDDEEARRQINELRNRTAEQQRQVDARIASIEASIDAIKGQSLLDLLNQVELLKADLAKLRGQIELLTNDIESTQKRQRDLYIDLDARLRKLETAARAAPPPAAPPPAVPAVPQTVPPGAGPPFAGAAAAGAAPAPAAPVPGSVAGAAASAGSVVPPGAAPAATPVAPGAAPSVPVAPARPPQAAAEIALEQRNYDAAHMQLSKGDYAGAGASFSAFVRAYPRSPLAPNAQYWYGHSLYALKDLRGAIAAHRQLIAAFPESSKAPDAMLSIATCLTELGDNAGARRQLEELVAKYPASEAGEKARRRLGR